MRQVLILPYFAKQLKYYTKKYRDLSEAVAQTLEGFDEARAVSLGRHLYKLRLKTRHLPRGKSSSFRLIILSAEVSQCLVPVMIYFKGVKANVSRKELNDHLEVILFELRTRL